MQVDNRHTCPCCQLEIAICSSHRELEAVLAIKVLSDHAAFDGDQTRIHERGDPRSGVSRHVANLVTRSIQHLWLAGTGKW